MHGGWCKKPEFDLSVAIAELLLSHGSDINLQDKVRFCFDFYRQNLVVSRYQIAKSMCDYSFLLFV